MGNSSSAPPKNQSILPAVDKLIADPTARVEQLMAARDAMYKQKSMISQSQARALQTLINATSKEQNMQSRYATLNSMINSRQKQGRNQVKIINNQK